MPQTSRTIWGGNQQAGTPPGSSAWVIRTQAREPSAVVSECTLNRSPSEAARVLIQRPQQGCEGPKTHLNCISKCQPDSPHSSVIIWVFLFYTPELQWIKSKLCPMLLIPLLIYSLSTEFLDHVWVAQCLWQRETFYALWRCSCVYLGNFSNAI